MSEATEVKIKISNPDQKYIKKYLSYEPLTISKEDPGMMAMVEQALKEFKGEVEEISVLTSTVWQ
jgi:hypothetical protein